MPDDAIKKQQLKIRESVEAYECGEISLKTFSKRVCQLAAAVESVGLAADEAARSVTAMDDLVAKLRETPEGR